jgi:hypothetical protein
MRQIEQGTWIRLQLQLQKIKHTERTIAGRQRFNPGLTDPLPIAICETRGGVMQNGRVFDMRGMLPPSEARMRMCVMQVGNRGRWTYRDWTKWRILWKFFPWYARELRYRGDFCIGASCMHWFWEDADKKERGYCSAAVSRTLHTMWQTDWEDHDTQARR